MSSLGRAGVDLECKRLKQSSHFAVDVNISHKSDSRRGAEVEPFLKPC